ncbi:hypothetical protein, partial [Cohnella phaseoli]|uniref:hypothetical protein n=1 Tax=Cohnella phaseoli TaxID=456490 RepID=UPI001C6E7980
KIQTDFWGGGSFFVQNPLQRAFKGSPNFRIKPYKAARTGLICGRLFGKSYKAVQFRLKRRAFVGKIVQIVQNQGFR